MRIAFGILMMIIWLSVLLIPIISFQCWVAPKLMLYGFLGMIGFAIMGAGEFGGRLFGLVLFVAFIASIIFMIDPVYANSINI